MTRSIVSTVILALLVGPSGAHAAGKLAMARKAVLQLPGVQKLRQGRVARGGEVDDIDKAMKIHFAGDRAFVVSVTEDANNCIGCERTYLGKIKGAEVDLKLIEPTLPVIKDQVKSMLHSTNAFSFYLDEKTNEVMLRGYGGALKPFKLQASGHLKAGPAFSFETPVRFDGTAGATRRVIIEE